MKALVCQEPGRFEWREQRDPRPAAGEVLVRIERVGVCGTDFHAFRGEQPFFSYPRVLGHELAGIVTATGGAVEDLRPGDPVCVVPYLGCGSCIACRNDRANCCERIAVLGVHRDGGLCESLVVPARHAIVAPGLDADRRALVECLAIGAHAVARARVEAGEWALVIGVGPIGLGVAQFARDAGARVIALDVDAERLRFARGHMGVVETVPAGAGAIARIAELTDGDMPTVVFDATGSAASMNAALLCVAHGGRLVLVGLTRQELHWPHPELHKREITVLCSRNAHRRDFERVIAAVAAGSIEPACLITHRCPFAAAAEVFREWLAPASGVVKALIELP